MREAPAMEAAPPAPRRRLYACKSASRACQHKPHLPAALFLIRFWQPATSGGQRSALALPRANPLLHLHSTSTAAGVRLAGAANIAEAYCQITRQCGQHAVRSEGLVAAAAGTWRQLQLEMTLQVLGLKNVGLGPHTPRHQLSLREP